MELIEELSIAVAALIVEEEPRSRSSRCEWDRSGGAEAPLTIPFSSGPVCRPRSLAALAFLLVE